jgi:hypothetical protein
MPASRPSKPDRRQREIDQDDPVICLDVLGGIDEGVDRRRDDDQVRHRVQGLEPTPDLGRVSFGAEDEQPRQKRRPPLAALPRFNR